MLFLPPAGVIKFLLDFFPKKSRVQGRALPQPAQGRKPFRAPPPAQSALSSKQKNSADTPCGAARARYM
ncbi:hypothetical protein D3Z52_19070 [Clostridiaceae bacterium]|nr:hypothetical protein [Clostridiaceae bacterium]